MTARSPQDRRSTPAAADVVCFGMVVPAIVLVVDRLPEHNTGTTIRQAAEFISDDAAIVACVLRGWQVNSGLIGTAVGRDPRGLQVERELARLGVAGKLRHLKTLTTPYEVNVSDSSGHRTYFWQRDPRVLDTLNTASLALLRGAGMLYVDWYDGSRIQRPMIKARELGIPVYLNLEHGHAEPGLLDSIASRATICQAVTDAAQREGDPVEIARRLLGAGVQIAIVTMAGGGSLVASGNGMLRVFAPQVQVIDGCGAGATFSAGVIYGILRLWGLGDTVRFATAAAALKCTTVGPRAFPLAQITRLAREVRVDRLD